MKKRTMRTNRAANHSSVVNMNPTALNDAVLLHVKGGGSPAPPDLYPNTHPTDPGPTS
jgi:hypothetical protein